MIYALWINKKLLTPIIQFIFPKISNEFAIYAVNSKSYSFYRFSCNNYPKDQNYFQTFVIVSVKFNFLLRRGALFLFIRWNNIEVLKIVPDEDSKLRMKLLVWGLSFMNNRANIHEANCCSFWNEKNIPLKTIVTGYDNFFLFLVNIF